MVLEGSIVGTVMESGNITWASGNSKVRFFSKKKIAEKVRDYKTQEEINLENLLAIGDKMFKDAVKEIDKIVSA